jgi:ATP-binding cassette subfamily F protein uup
VRSVIETALLIAAEVSDPSAARALPRHLAAPVLKIWKRKRPRLSGGWRNVRNCEALVQHPDILLLDEPTNHLDLPGITWLEALLEAAAFASVIVSHDRYFLENVTTDMVELNRIYPDGSLRVHGSYQLSGEEEGVPARAVKRQEALKSCSREIEWLRRGRKPEHENRRRASAGGRAHGRACRPQSENPQHHNANRFFRHRPQD